ncbi:MAG: PEP-CTERM sorting domain-containing protein, partial [Pseudomonadota bacterium]|nr:PEP-CTERM sorting domain-containing protein [Pseudomonadota bacterium]
FNGDPLTITFSTPVVDRILIPFGVEDAFGTFGPDTLTLTANTGQTITAGTTLNSLTLAEPEGAFNFVPTRAITSLTITSANPFAIASVDVPEPMSLSLMGMSLAGMAAVRRKKRAH